MNPTTLVAWYTALAAIALPILGFLYVALPILGRFVATWAPRAGEAFIRLGGDIGGALAAKRLDPLTPSVSAQPLHESAAAVMASQPSVRPKRDPETPSTRVPKLPPMGPLGVLCALLLVGCQLTPAQTAAIVGDVPKIAGAVCDALDDATDSPFVTFACKVLDAGKPIAGAGPNERVDEIRIQIPRAQAAKFASEHGGAKGASK